MVPQSHEPRRHQDGRRRRLMDLIAIRKLMNSRRFTLASVHLSEDKAFRDATLQSARGQLLSANHHVMMLADQERARRQCQEVAAGWQALKREFPTADYYRFFPELSGHLTK